MTISEWLQTSLRLPDSYVRKLLVDGRVRVTGTALTPTDPVPVGKRVWLEDDVVLEDAEVVRSAATVSVLYEDDHLLVVDKPAGLLVHSDGTGVVDTLDERVSHYIRQNKTQGTPLHVHRLDRDTTGCVLYAKHAFAARALDIMMQERFIHRTYLAIVSGAPPMKQGRLDGPIGRDRHHSGAYRISATGKEAVTHYQRLRMTDQRSLSLVSCQLETGRTHQIRVHLSAIHCPVLGDELYGGKSEGDGWSFSGPGQALHAWHLSLQHPYSGHLIEVEAPVPESFIEIFDVVGWSLDPEEVHQGARD